ncbi:hypothetical protein HDU91_001691 [Kappamyces sp. JEL0680]|nr:hypothetical protein HDU91_001691 [Kappamyces sp. JEL0680]
MFVLNHQLGGLDIPLGIASIYLQTGLWPRAIQDRLHLKIPIYKQLTNLLGAFVGTRESCRVAMEAGMPLLVYPGGADEIWRTRDTAPYTLQWKDRKGFATMALEHGYTLVPVSMVGMEDMLNIVFEIPAQKMMAMMGDARSKNTGFKIPIFLPNGTYQRQYISFGNPVETAHLAETKSDPDTIASVRDAVRNEMRDGLKAALHSQSEDPRRFISFR